MGPGIGESEPLRGSDPAHPLVGLDLGFPADRLRGVVVPTQFLRVEPQFRRERGSGLLRMGRLGRQGRLERGQRRRGKGGGSRFLSRGHRTKQQSQGKCKKMSFAHKAPKGPAAEGRNLGRGRVDGTPARVACEGTSDRFGRSGSSD